jgi:Fur family ferric uptake transcriptional regulator/Fur family peroxide stress response transcriptional regulator
MEALFESHKYLKDHSIKPSVQRSAVMNFLIHNRIHPTIDEIFTALSPSMPTLSKTTIYNTLHLFVKQGAVRMLTLDEKNARYDINTSAHAHFICKRCEKVHDIFSLDESMYVIPCSNDFEIESLEISYVGTCNTCKSN